MTVNECPKCGHGESWYTWFGSHGDPMGRCYRASCGHVGPLGGLMVAADIKRERTPRYYTRPYKQPTAEQDAAIYDRFGLPPGTVEGYNEIDDRFILGIDGPAHQRRGHIAYSLSGATPKSLTYNEKPDQPFIHWTMKFYPPAIVLVEDWFSAEKVREAGATGVALLGTNLTQDSVNEITQVATAWNCPTFVALDRDAYTRTLLYLSKYREQFPLGLYAWSLLRDLKYETVERIKRGIDGEYDFTARERDISGGTTVEGCI